MLRRLAPATLILASVLSACSASTTETSATSSQPETTTGPATTTSDAATETTIATGDGTVTTTAAPPATVAQAELPLTPTPAQQEGPYYPVARLDDQDNDLTVVDGLGGVAVGDVLLLKGTLLTTGGEPVAGATIEIWQTDASGIYLHPGDAGVADRDPFFQGAGVATVAEDGSWSFRTLNPGYYEPRPRHIHVKVHVDDRPVLTTQIYFSDDPQAADIDALLVAKIETSGDELIATHRIVLTR